jgi:CBS domain-containing protein
MQTVKQLLESKGGSVVTIAPSASVFQALELMAERDIGAVMVVGDDGHVVGILSERDYARKVILHSKSSKEISVDEIMTDRVLYVSLAHTVEDCMALMTDKRIRHLPVMDADRLVGVLSIGDLVKAAINERDFTIRQLENYITS